MGKDDIPMAEDVHILDMKIDAWVAVSTPRNLKNYVRAIKERALASGKKPRVVLIKHYDFGGHSHGWNVVIREVRE